MAYERPYSKQSIAKCSAKLEAELLKNSRSLLIDQESMICFLPGRLAGFGGFIYRIKDLSCEAEILIKHDGFDIFACHLYIIDPETGKEVMTHADTVPFEELISKLLEFTTAAVSGFFDFEVMPHDYTELFVDDQICECFWDKLA